jgi:hypothetical protein
MNCHEACTILDGCSEGCCDCGWASNFGEFRNKTKIAVGEELTSATHKHNFAH